MPGFLSLFERTKEKLRTPLCSAVIVAAGSARRMNGIDKMLAPLGDVPVLVRTLLVFQECPAIQEIVVVVREDQMGEVREMCSRHSLDKVSQVVAGGEIRTHSVRNGIRQVCTDADLIAIHDGARPLVTGALIEKAVAQARKTGAAAPAVPVTDTLKRVEGDLAVETVDREPLRAVQTPQVFEAGLIKGAVEKAFTDGVALTDDCAAVERIGMKVVLTPGSRENIKITTPLDLLLGEAILAARDKGGSPE